MKEVKIFDVPVEVFEDLLPETFEYLVAKFKEFVQDYIDNDDADLSKIIKFIVETMDDLEWFYRGVKMGKKAYTLMIDERIAEAGKKDAADYGVTFDQYVQDLIEQDVSVEFLEEEEE